MPVLKGRYLEIRCLPFTYYSENFRVKVEMFSEQSTQELKHHLFFQQFNSLLNSIVSFNWV